MTLTPSPLVGTFGRRAQSRGRRGSTRLLDPLEDRILDEGRVARNDESHLIARVQQHVEVGDLLGERHEHRSLSGGDLHQEPISFSLLAYHLTFDTFTRPAGGLRQVRRDQRGSPVRRAEADDHTDDERAEEDEPSPHLAAAPCSSVIRRVEDWRGTRLSPFPAPASSNGADGFPVRRSPVCFASWVM